MITTKLETVFIWLKDNIWNNIQEEFFTYKTANRGCKKTAIKDSHDDTVW